jgi:hypothetical protein
MAYHWQLVASEATSIQRVYIHIFCSVLFGDQGGRNGERTKYNENV